MPPAVEVWSLNHWTAREVPILSILHALFHIFVTQTTLVKTTIMPILQMKRKKMKHEEVKLPSVTQLVHGRARISLNPGSVSPESTS